MTHNHQVIICLSSSDDLKGRLVRFFTKYQFNHVSIIYKSMFINKWMSIEVSKNGVHILPVYAVIKKNMYNKFYKCDYNLSLGISKNTCYIGRNYDIWGVFGIGVRIIIQKLFGVKIKNLFNIISKVFCTEYVVKVLIDSGFKGSDKIDPSLSEPRDIEDLLSNNNECKEIFITDLEFFK